MRFKPFSILFICIISFLILIGTFIGLLPRLISTPWGQNILTSWINRSIPGQIEIQHLNLQWGSGQEIQGFLLRDPEGLPIMGFEKISTNGTLWQIINKKIALQHIELQDLNASIVTDENGISNLQYALGLPADRYYRLSSSSTILLSDVYAELNRLSKHSPLSLDLKGSTRQGNTTGSFDIHIALPFLQWQQLNQATENILDASKHIKMTAKVVNFPVDFIDRVIALQQPEWNGIFRAIFGETINIDLDKEPEATDLSFNLALLSPLMQGAIKAKIIEQKLILQEPALFQFQLIPNAINPFLQKYLSLIDPTTVKISWDHLQFPLSFLTKNNLQEAKELDFKAKVVADPTYVDIFPIGKTQVTQFQANLSSVSGADNIHASIQGQAQQEAEPFNFELNTEWQKPSNICELLQAFTKENRFTFKVSHLPLNLFNFEEELSQILLNSLGSHIDFELEAHTFANQAGQLNLSIHTPYLQIQQAVFKVDPQEIQLLAPLKIDYQADRSIIPTFLQTSDYLSPRLPLNLTLQNIKIPLTSDKHGNFNCSFQCKARTPDPLMAVLGNSIQVFASSCFKMGEAYNPEVACFKTEIKSDHLFLSTEAKWLPYSKLIFTSPTQLRYQLTPEVFQLTQVTTGNFYQLMNQPEIRLSFEPFQIILKDFSLNAFNMKGLLDIDHLMLQDSLGVNAQLQQLNIPLELHGSKNSVYLDVKGWVIADSQPNPSRISGEFLISNWLNQGQWDLSRLKIEANARLMRIPTLLISSFFAQHDLVPLIGSDLDIELKTLIDRSQETLGYWDMNLNGTYLHSRLRFKIQEALSLYNAPDSLYTIYEHRPKIVAEVSWTLTPEGFQHLKTIFGDTVFDLKTALAKPVTFSGQLLNLYIPLDKTTPQLKGSKIQAVLKADELVWANEAEPVPLSLQAQLDTQDLSDQIDFNIQLNTQENTLLSIEGIATHPFDKTELLAPTEDWLQLKFKGHSISSKILSTFLLSSSYQEHIQNLIGMPFQIQGDCKVQHTQDCSITTSVQGTLGEVSFDGSIKKGILKLNKPFEWNYLLTPALTKKYFSQTILETAQKSEEPIKLVIQPQGFSLPVLPKTDFSQLHIENGKVDLGRISFLNKNELKKILNTFKTISEEQLTIWFTPVYFRISNDQLIIKRVDMLIAERYPLATWGEINLKTQQINMVLGLTAETLRQAFSINGLKADYLLQIPLKSKKGVIELDRKKILARLGVLVAQTHAEGKGKIFETALELISSKGARDALPPKPTTEPFPWKIDTAN